MSGTKTTQIKQTVMSVTEHLLLLKPSTHTHVTRALVCTWQTAHHSLIWHQIIFVHCFGSGADFW